MDDYSGMFLRQYMGQTSNAIPNATDDWLYSPDLLVYGTAAAYSTSNFNNSSDDYESRSWFFSQAPTPGAANYVYVRGLSLSPNFSCTVYLYCCEAATLLQPKNWLATGFTVAQDQGAPTSVNHFNLTSVSVKQLVTSYDAVNQKGSLVTWTPPAASGTPHYYLIAWIDNSGTGGDPPPFSDLSAFADLPALARYVKAHPNMAMLDTWYNGTFVRQYAGQLNYQQGTAAQASPDLIVTGTSAAPDWTAYAAQSSYASTTLNQNGTLRMRNFVYVRGLNTTSAQKTSRVYLYYTTSDQLSPVNWRSDTFTVAGRSCNYVDITAAAGGIAVSQLPVVWLLDGVNSGANYVLISYTDDSGEPQPPDFSIFGYVNDQMIQQFVATQPRISWLHINGSPPPQAPDLSYEFPLGVGAGNAYVGLQFTNINTSCTMSFSVPGSAASNTLVVQGMHVPDPNAAVSWLMNFPAALNTSLVLNLWANQGSNGNGANVKALVIKPAS
jgi:hypothetical protein